MSQIHILNQYTWPDCAPDALYAEQLAAALQAAGHNVVLVGGTGSYRVGDRKNPGVPMLHVDHYRGKRHRFVSVAAEYFSVAAAFGRYIRANVNTGDIVIASSAPPATYSLHSQIHRKHAVAVYWLQDCYPELVRTIWDYPAWIRRRVLSYWSSHLRKWDQVIKCAGNLGYDGPNATVIRNWPTLDLGEPRPFIPRTALYSGNLGYSHDISLFVAKCQELREQGYRINVRGDGIGIKKLPPWINAGPGLDNHDELIAGYWDAEVHLVAANPRFTRSIFPSKYWNCRATGRKIICTGFADELRAELTEAEKDDFRQNRTRWVKFVESIVP